MCECCGSNNKSVEFTVSGIGCETCVKSIEQSVQQLRGIKDIRVNQEFGKVGVAFNPNDINEKLIKSAIEDAGFDVE